MIASVLEPFFEESKGGGGWGVVRVGKERKALYCHDMRGKM